MGGGRQAQKTERVRESGIEREVVQMGRKRDGDGDGRLAPGTRASLTVRFACHSY